MSAPKGWCAGANTAFLYAGQGAQYVGMGLDAATEWTWIGKTYAEADAVLDPPISEIIERGPDGALTLTENAQPAILALGVAHARICADLGLEPSLVMGHSLGEYGAWVSAGAVDFADAVKLVRLRGRFMQEAVPVGVGAMSAIISAEASDVERVCEEVARSTSLVVRAAVYNCPGNTVVSGHLEAVEAVEAQIEAESLGVARRLAVSAPFHTSLLEPAARSLRLALADVHFRANQLPVASNVTGAVVEPGADPAAIRDLLVRQVVEPVRWEACMRAALERGVEQVVLLGPGSMLRGHVKRVQRRLPAANLDGMQDLGVLTAAE